MKKQHSAYGHLVFLGIFSFFTIEVVKANEIQINQINLREHIKTSWINFIEKKCKEDIDFSKRFASIDECKEHRYSKDNGFTWTNLFMPQYEQPALLSDTSGLETISYEYRVFALIGPSPKTEEYPLIELTALRDFTLWAADLESARFVEKDQRFHVTYHSSMVSSNWVPNPHGMAAIFCASEEPLRIEMKRTNCSENIIKNPHSVTLVRLRENLPNYVRTRLKGASPKYEIKAVLEGCNLTLFGPSGLRGHWPTEALEAFFERTKG